MNRALARNRAAMAAVEAAREVAMAHPPAGTMGMIAEAVAAVVPDPEGMAAGAPTWRGERLTEASAEDAASSLSNAMRFDERGEARRTGYEFAVGMAARQLVPDLALSGDVVMRRPPATRHTAGG